MKLKRTIIGALLAFATILSMGSPALAAGTSSDASLEQISRVYEIPMEDLAAMPEVDVKKLSEDIDSTKQVSTSETYWAFTQKGGTISATQHTASEYESLMSKQTRASTPAVHETDWMRITTNVYSANETEGAATGVYEWLTLPSGLPAVKSRLTDYIALTITDGILDRDSAMGYYRCDYNTFTVDPKHKYEYYKKQSDFYGLDGSSGSPTPPSNRSLVVKQSLYKPNEPVSGDRFFLYARFTKNGNGEGVCASYAHQKLGLDLSVSVSFDSTGSISISPQSKFEITSCYASTSYWPDYTNVFTDVPSSKWYADAVEYVASHGYMNGTSDTKFSPDANMTRAMVVTILWRIENEPYTGTNSFSDVAYGTWYTNAVNWASSAGIVNGYKNQTFRPDDNVTREQFTAILYRYAQYKNYPTAKTSTLSGYKDAGAISDYARSPFKWAVGSGFINGRNSTTLAPQGTASRAEVATLFQRFLEANP